MTTQRLFALDVFRGLTIAAMLLVNNPGDWGHIYSPLEHAEWSGWTLTDCVFPFFLFIGGMSMSVSLDKRAAAGFNQGSLLMQLQKRAAIIFLIGLAMNLIPSWDWHTLRIPGVLQRIALCIVICGTLVLLCSSRQITAWIVGLLTVYSVLMLQWPVLDADGILVKGVLEPGRDAGSAIDRALLGTHLWQKARTWDPEGLLSTLPAVTNMLAGVLCMRFLQSARGQGEKTLMLIVAGLFCCAAGKWLDMILMPVNKSLWTPSYAVLMNGLALLSFAVLYHLLDAQPLQRWQASLRRIFQPFAIYGMNALFIFILSGLFARLLLFTHVTLEGQPVTLQAYLYRPLRDSVLAPQNASLAYALLFNLLMFIVAWGMWKKRWFVKV